MMATANGARDGPPEGEEDMEKTAEQETAKTFQRTRMVVMAAAFAALAAWPLWW